MFLAKATAGLVAILLVSFGASALESEPVPGAPSVEASASVMPPMHPTATQAIGLPQLSEASQTCIDCHKRESLALYQQWGASKHYRGNVGCYECHRAERGDADAMNHYDYTISVIVSPKDCARCHQREVEEFAGSSE